MSWGFVAVGGASLAGAYLGGEAARDAGRASERGANRATAEQRRQFDLIQELLAPYAEGGEEALAAQRALLGLAGPEEQQAAIDQLTSSPQFTSAVNQGEEAILANASATGGLRGGNVQSALAEFRPQMLSNLIQQQFANLGGITSMGQNAAAMTGNAGMQTGSNISNVITRDAENQANAGLARTAAYTDALGTVGGLGGTYLAGGGF